MSEKDSVIIPKFDGDYEHWAMLMENLLRSKEWWDLIETGISQPEPNVILNGAQRTERAERIVKDHKVKNYLFASIDKTILKTILKKETSKELWDSMKKKYQGDDRVKSAQLQRLRRSFEVLEMRAGEVIEQYVSRVMEVTNDMRNLGEEMPDSKVVEKILRTLTEKYTYMVCAIEESKNINEMSVDGLQSSLMVHEQNLSRHTGEEHALKVESQWKPEGGRGRGRSPYRGRGRGGYQGRGGGSSGYNKEHVECFKCHKKGHYKSECPEWEKEANFVEMEEDMLLMAHIDEIKGEEHIWFLDSGCSNHMCGNKDWFVELDSSFRQNVKLGDDRRMMVEGRGNLRLEINGSISVITSVYYVPGLKNNLFSLGQLQQKGLKVVIDEDVCEIWNKQFKRLVLRTTMTKNRMFIVQARVKEARETVETKCLQVMEKPVQIWHKRLGHLSHTGLRSLVEKQMVNGIIKLDQDESEAGLCEICMRGKQIRESIPKKSLWKSTRGLQLVHSDICGPISPTSAGEAERELGQSLVCLRTDRGGEYNSKAFEDYCRENGIKRQLTAAYTPQQNGIAERKNRSVMNMTRCLLLEKSVPRRFWPEAVQYAVHILNRSPSAALEDVTPQEKWSNHKPTVEHLRIFGCIAYAMIPYERRIKLDEKSAKCVMFGLSKESKAYRLYNPETKKIVISRDVQFDESKGWDWRGTSQDKELVWSDTELDSDEEKEVENPGDTLEETVAEEENDDGDNTEEVEEQQPNQEVRRSGRSSQAPIWMKDYVAGNAKTANFVITEDGDDIFAMFIAAEDPESFEEAVREKVWRKAMEAEISSIEENNTWELMELPEGVKVIGMKWIFKTKLNERGQINKFKARLVAKGYHQKQGVDYYEVFAPVAKWDTIRSILALAAEKAWKVYQLDVKSAFLHGELEEDVYVEQPKGFEVKDEEDKVYKLKKALYGLKQAPRAWYSRIEGYFLREGFEKCYCEHTLFVKKKNEEVLLVSLYVDDLIYTGNSDSMLGEFKDSMMKEFSMTDLGKMKFFLGVEVIQDEHGIFINQRKYAEETLKKYGMEECNPVKNPIVPGHKLSKVGAGEAVDSTMYKQLVGSLRYLTATRPDLIFSVNLVSRYMENPTEQHLLATKRILRYIKGTTAYGIQYKPGGDQRLVEFVDSDYAGDVDDRKSTSGYVFMLGGGAVSWSSKKQPIVTLSTTEAEFVAAAFGACQAVWLRNVLEEIGSDQGEGTVIFCDNSSTIKLTKNPVLHGRSKHIHVRYHFLRELVNDGIIQLDYCSTGDQLSDVMTKAVKLEVFEKLRGRMGICSKKE